MSLAGEISTRLLLKQSAVFEGECDLCWTMRNVSRCDDGVCTRGGDEGGAVLALLYVRRTDGELDCSEGTIVSVRWWFREEKPR